MRTAAPLALAAVLLASACSPGSFTDSGDQGGASDLQEFCSLVNETAPFTPDEPEAFFTWGLENTSRPATW